MRGLCCDAIVERDSQHRAREGGRGRDKEGRREEKLTSWNLAASVCVGKSIGGGSKIVEALDHVLGGAKRVCNRAWVVSSALSLPPRKAKAKLTPQRRLIEPKTRTIILTLSFIIHGPHSIPGLLSRLHHGGSLERERRVGKRMRLEREGLDVPLLEEKGFEGGEDENS